MDTIDNNRKPGDNEKDLSVPTSTVPTIVHDDTTEFKAYCKKLTEECGLSVNFILVSTDVDNKQVSAIDIYHHADNLSFDILKRLSVAFRSTLIDLTCELGCASDRSHDPIIRIRRPFLG